MFDITMYFLILNISALGCRASFICYYWILVDDISLDFINLEIYIT